MGGDDGEGSSFLGIRLLTVRCSYPFLRLERIFLAVAVTMTFVFLWASVAPVASRIAPSGLHQHLTHFASFGVLAMAWSFAYPRVPSVLVLLPVATFGFIQEAIEIVGHGHAFEFSDAFVDAVGTVAGVAFSRLVQIPATPVSTCGAPHARNALQNDAPTQR